MPFTVKEFHDLVRILEEQPEWRSELRRLVLTEELLTLPELVRSVAEAQHRTEEQLARLIEVQGRAEERLTRLEEAQIRTEERLTRLEEAVLQLTEAQRRAEERLARLEEVQVRAEARMDRMEKRMDQMAQDLGELKGDSLERRYREHATAYFSPLVRRVHVFLGEELMTMLEEAMAQGLLLEEEVDDVALADLVVRGRQRDGAQVYLIVEVSWVVKDSDVERVQRRASFLAKSGTPTLAVVAGRDISRRAAKLCRQMNVWQLIDGRSFSPA